MTFKKIFILLLLASFSNSSYANQSVEEIIKGRKAMFSENYQNGKKISILLKSKKIEEAKPLMKKMSDNYKKLLDYFPDNTKEGFKTEALPSIWENKDEFNALMQKTSAVSIAFASLIISSDAFCIKALNSSLFSQILGRASVLNPSFEFSGK